MTKLTVILCTYNRCQILNQALESVAASQLPESVEWEVLVVDNNSTDQTRDVVDTFSKAHPRFRYIFERKQGKSYALNAGIREASGDILAFTDDDIVVAPTWLWGLASPLASGEWGSSGGRIGASNTFQCPPWLALQGKYSLGSVLGFFDLGDKAGSSQEAFYGGNVAYRREVFEKCGLYRTDLGRSGTSLLSSEDTEFSRRVMTSGARLWYEPSAVVYHAVPKERLSKGHFLNYFYHHGRSRIRESANRANVRGIPRWLFSVPYIVLNLLAPRMRKWLFTLDLKRRFYFKCLVWGTFGEIVELPRLGSERKQSPRSTGQVMATRQTHF
jgi:glycosyltransferase involved in cell wall biosynthesis